MILICLLNDMADLLTSFVVDLQEKSHIGINGSEVPAAKKDVSKMEKVYMTTKPIKELGECITLEMHYT